MSVLRVFVPSDLFFSFQKDSIGRPCNWSCVVRLGPMTPLVFESSLESFDRNTRWVSLPRPFKYPNSTPWTCEPVVHFDARHPRPSVSGGAWQEPKNQMSSNGNSRPVGGHLACSNTLRPLRLRALFFLPPPLRHPGSASLPSRPKSWTAAWFQAHALWDAQPGPVPSSEPCRLLPLAEL